MADDKKVIFSMVGVSKIIPPQRQILKNIYLSFFYGAKIGIIGLNGSGKSTLLKIIAGLDKSYQGNVVFSPGYSVGYLEQDPKLDPDKTVREVVEEGVLPVMALLKEYILTGKDIAKNEDLAKHAEWVAEFLPHYTSITEETIDQILEQEIGKVFVQVLEDAGVYKWTEEGHAAFLRFVQAL